MRRVIGGGARWPRPTVLLIWAVAAIGLFIAVDSARRLSETWERHPLVRHERPTTAEIAGWMTVPYIAHRFGCPPRLLFTSLGVPAAGNRHRSIDEIAAETRRASAQVAALVRTTVQQYRASRKWSPLPSGQSPPRRR